MSTYPYSRSYQQPEKPNRLGTFLKCCAGIALFGGLAGAVTASIAAVSMPVLIPSMVLGYGLAAGAAGLTVAATAVSGFSLIEYGSYRHPFLSFIGGLASMVTFGIGAIANVALGVEATHPFDSAIQKSLTEAANTSFGPDWRTASKGDVLTVTVPIGKSLSLPTTATVDSAWARLQAHEGYKHSAGPVKMDSAIRFNVVSALPGKTQPYTTAISIGQSRDLTRSEIQRLVP